MTVSDIIKNLHNIKIYQKSFKETVPIASYLHSKLSAIIRRGMKKSKSALAMVSNEDPSLQFLLLILILLG